MASRVLRRRAVTAAALYGGTAAGILGTLIAVRVLGPSQFGLLSLALATAGFVQLLLDTTVEEAVVKYGFRYAATEDWARLRGLFRTGLLVKWGGGAAATVIILLLVPFTAIYFRTQGCKSSPSPCSARTTACIRGNADEARRRNQVRRME